MLLDTHVLIWAMLAPDLLSGSARDALLDATERCVSAASLYEITCKAMLGKWPEVEKLLSVDLDTRLRSDGFEVIPASGAVMELAGRLAWAHRDPFDRIIVATALERAMPVVSKDETLDTVPGGRVQRIW
ncbi:type II toxin-antitoxin system VapC family toxin [uncultured Jannaschia sp.]|uniref:type II toxin-antitoxin system VapC family toxin n=1 Tax=uncultured Jannaschia sp. TaxID=293347 RepID=UPI002631B16C|nr:type II toxin-antitoxin system VapC family toxin [uncultured Jannaschia sp.]